MWFPASAVSSYLPSISVALPFVVPLIMTFTKGIASLLTSASVINPATFPLFCAKLNAQMKKVRHRKLNFIFIIVKFDAKKETQCKVGVNGALRFRTLIIILMLTD